MYIDGVRVGYIRAEGFAAGNDGGSDPPGFMIETNSNAPSGVSGYAKFGAEEVGTGLLEWPFFVDGANNKRPLWTRGARALTPYPSQPFGSAQTNVLLPAVGTGGIVGHVIVPVPIKISNLRYSVQAAGSGGSSTATVRCVIYTSDGQSKLVDVTDAVNTNSGVRSVSVSPNYVLEPGDYFLGIGLSATTLTTQPTIVFFALLDIFQEGSGAIDLEGTMTWTSGAAPSTFDPAADITVTADRVPFFQLLGADFP
jgi:hypothetical protein